MKPIIAVLAVWLLGISYASAQTGYSFDPDFQITETLPVDESFSQFWIYMNNETDQDLLLTWRHIDSSIPDEWTVNLCDYVECYDGIPNDADMSPIPVGEAGYLKVIVSTENIPGEGTLHFWVYPTGEPSEHQDVFFHFNTGGMTINEPGLEGVKVFPNPASDVIYLSNASAEGGVELLDLSGRVILSQNLNLSRSLDTSNLTGGIYFLRMHLGKEERTVKVIIK